MKFHNICTPLAFLVLLGVGNASNGAGEEVTPDSADAENLAPPNSLVIETDHGEGLGPNGTDLHYENDDQVASDDDAKLFLQSLEEPTPIDSETEIEERTADAISADTRERQPRNAADSRE